MRNRPLLVILVTLLALAGCGGGSGSGASQGGVGGAPIVPTSVVSAATSPGASASPGSVQATGQIQGLFSGGFRLQTGSHGLLDVFTNVSTTYTGAAPYVGESVTVIGGGSLSTSITASSVTQNLTGAATPAPLATPNLSTISGPVTNLRTNGVLLKTAAHGYLWVTTNASTTFIGGAPAVGGYETFVGTGSFSSIYTAVAASQTSAAPASTTAMGTIVAGTAYGFTIDVNSTYPSVPIMLTSATVIAGGTLEVGATASVTGTGSTSGSILAVNVVVTDPTPNVPPTPTPTPIAQTHIATADYLGAPNGTQAVTPAQAAPYLTWAQTGTGAANAIAAAGIKTQIYEDPNRTVPDGSLYSAGASGGFAQTCSGANVTEFSDNVTQNVMNPASSALQARYTTVLNSIIAKSHFDAVYQDDNGPLSEYAYPYSPSLPCNYTDAAWISGNIALDQSAPLPVILNGLSGLNGQSPSLSMQLLSSSNAMGGNFEGCYATVNEPKNYGWLWTAEENTELQVNALGKMFSCQERDTTDAASSTSARLYAYASFLLTYDPTLDVLWEDFATPSGLQVFPEEQLVALDPAVATPTSIDGLAQTGGAYGRVYNECFVAGQFVGACAVAVNPNQGSNVPFPFPQFTHTLTVSGEGVLDGGTLSTQGAAPPVYLTGVQAVIAFP